MSRKRGIECNTETYKGDGYQEKERDGGGRREGGEGGREGDAHHINIFGSIHTTLRCQQKEE